MANERGTLCFFAFSSSLRPHLGSSDDSRKGTPHSGHQRREGAWAAARKLRDKGDPASRSLGVQSAVSTAESARPGPCSAPRTAPRPLALCSRQRAPVPAALWPHQSVVPASLMAQRTGNRPPADDREDSSDAVSGGGRCPCPSRPCPSRLPLEVSVLVSHFACHCPSLRGSRGPRFDPALDGHLPSLSSRVLLDAELQAQAFSVSAHQRLLGFLWIPAPPTPGNAQGPSV